MGWISPGTLDQFHKLCLIDVTLSMVFMQDQPRWIFGRVIDPEVVHEPTVVIKQIPQAGVKSPSDSFFGYAMSALEYPVGDAGHREVRVREP
jgi:hypothetical protein